MSSSAPSVEFDLPERRGIGTVARGTAVLGSVSLLCWWFGTAPAVDESWRFVLGAAAGVSLMPALLWSPRDPPCRLRYDGQMWWLCGASAGGEQPAQQARLQLIFDLQSAMLLRLVVASGGRSSRKLWLGVRRRDLGSRWHEWRGAVVGSRAHASPLAGTETSG